MGIPQIAWTEREQTNYIVLHGANTAPSKKYGADHLRGLHMRQGLLDIGYHYVIRMDGIIDLGRPSFSVGNHTETHNEDSIGVAFIGGIDKDYNPEDNFSSLQIRVCKGLVATLIQMHPEAEIVSHNELEGGDNEFMNSVASNFRESPLGEFD